MTQATNERISQLRGGPLTPPALLRHTEFRDSASPGAPEYRELERLGSALKSFALSQLETSTRGALKSLLRNTRRQE